jgi:hypothetical protein
VRKSDYFAEALDFFGGDATAEVGNAVITAALVIEVRSGPLAAFLDRAIVEKFLDRSIERTGARVKGGVGTAANFAEDGVAMALAIG